MNNQGMKSIIVKNTVIDTLGTGAVPVDLPIESSSAGNWRVQPDIPVGFGVDDPAIRRVRAGTGAGVASADSDGAAPFRSVSGPAIAPEYHAAAGLTDRGAVGIDLQLCRQGSRTSAILVEVNKRPDLIMEKKLISRVIVMSGIKTEVTDRNAG